MDIILNNYYNNSSELIRNAKDVYIFLHYSIDDSNTDDCKADRMLWENHGQNLINQKTFSKK